MTHFHQRGVATVRILTLVNNTQSLRVSLTDIFNIFEKHFI